MARKTAPPTAETAEADLPERQPWFDADVHRVEARGIVMAATGDLLAEDGLPVNALLRAVWLETAAAEAAAVVAQPALADLNASATNDSTTPKRVEADQE